MNINEWDETTDREYEELMELGIPKPAEDTLTYLEQFQQEVYGCFDEMKYLRERGVWF